MTRTSIDLPEPDVLVNAALFLMTQHARSHCPAVGRAIAQHLSWLAAHPGAAIAPGQRRFYRELAVQWAESAAGYAIRKAGRESLPAGAAAGAYLQ